MDTVEQCVRFAGATLGSQRHVCAFFHSTEEEYRVLLPFIAEGLDQGEKAFHIVDPSLRAEHLRRLREVGIDTAAAEERGQLEVRRWQDAHLREGHFDQDRMLSLIEDILGAGPARVFRPTRLVAHMEWALEDLPGVSNLVEFESRLNHVLPKYKDTVICVYDYARFSAAAAADILRTHPLVLIGGILQENPFYVPPEELLVELRERIAYRNRRKELEAAALIQRGLMAVRIPQLSFAVVSGANAPCTEIGGDFFSVTAIDEGVAVTIADVSGKGISAAIMASLLQGMIHEGLASRASLPDIARGVNEFFCERDLCSKYATLVIARVQPGGELEYLNCAHVPPLIATSRGSIVRLRESNLPLGLFPHAKYESATARLWAGDRLILVTDGVTEAQSPTGDFFGDERLETCAREVTGAEQVIRSAHLFSAGRPIDDDCTVVELSYLGGAQCEG